MARPRLQVELTLFDRILIVLGWLGFLLLTLVPLLYYDQLPEVIPTHFGLDGKADGF